MLYKFLRKGSIGPYSGFRWPTPNPTEPADWVNVEGPLRLASNAIHACRVSQLPYWLDAELWELELEAPFTEAERHVLGRRGRLTRRIDEWTSATAAELARACVERSRSHATSALREHGADDQAAMLEESYGVEDVMVTGYETAAELPPSLATVVFDSADTAFAVHSGMSACLAGYLAARTAQSAASASDGWSYGPRRRHWARSCRASSCPRAPLQRRYA